MFIALQVLHLPMKNLAAKICWMALSISLVSTAGGSRPGFFDDFEANHSAVLIPKPQSWRWRQLFHIFPERNIESIWAYVSAGPSLIFPSPFPPANCEEYLTIVSLVYALSFLRRSLDILKHNEEQVPLHSFVKSDTLRKFLPFENIWCLLHSLLISTLLQTLFYNSIAGIGWLSIMSDCHTYASRSKRPPVASRCWSNESQSSTFSESEYFRLNILFQFLPFNIEYGKASERNLKYLPSPFAPCMSVQYWSQVFIYSYMSCQVFFLLCSLRTLQ
jgi:hypothetical protein